MRRQNRAPIIEYGAIALIDQAQQMSGSGNTTDEAAARAHLDLLPVFVKWLSAERHRGTPDEIVLSLLPALVTAQVATAVATKFPDGKRASKMMDRLKTCLDEEWRLARNQVRRGRK
jgi:hypothetical protein